MSPNELRAKQAPFKTQYKDDPASALVTLRAVGELRVESVSCRLQFGVPPQNAGLHPLAGGDGTQACSAEMLLHALVGCAGVTFGAVATAMEIPVRGGTITAEGDVDFRGTLGVSRDVPVGFQAIRMKFDLDTDAPPEKLAKLIELTERYCVVYQTLKNSPKLASELASK
ncbi:MAG: OsmC family protein [Planctomycetota bacterium]